MEAPEIPLIFALQFGKAVSALEASPGKSRTIPSKLESRANTAKRITQAYKIRQGNGRHLPAE